MQPNMNQNEGQPLSGDAPSSTPQSSTFQSSGPLPIETRAGTAKSELFRYGTMLPVAGIMTIGLMLAMAGLVATEFTPQDKSETASFEINPKIEELPEHVRDITLDPLKEVEVPPPPPTIATVKVAEVTLPIVEVPGQKTVFDIGLIDMGPGIETVNIDKDPTPLVRIPPVFPNRFMQGDASGYCQVQFDINPQGQPFNISATLCTDKQLQSPTVKSVKQWKYAPQMRGGQAVTRSGLKTTIRFDLQDERGKVLPLPSGF